VTVGQTERGRGRGRGRARASEGAFGASAFICSIVFGMTRALIIRFVRAAGVESRVFAVVVGVVRQGAFVIGSASCGQSRVCSRNRELW